MEVEEEEVVIEVGAAFGVEAEAVTVEEEGQGTPAEEEPGES